MNEFKEVNPETMLDQSRVHGDHLLIREYPKKEVSGDIVLPDAAQERRLMGWVIQVGDEVQCPIQVGDTVIYNALNAWNLPDLGADIRLLKVKDASVSIPKE
ncbi:MAG TPA: hypothetical protein VMZ92_21100 [Planctomycetota bacterium]|nr:hypothetical protein [Planctomycetota bacterium]